MSKNILIPLTKSNISHKILGEVEKFIQTEDNKLILYYVTKPPKGMGFAAPDYRSDYALESDGEPLGPKTFPVFSSQEEDSLRAEIEVDLLPIMNQLKQHGYSVAIQVCFLDDVVGEIVRIVKRDKIDLIAMSTQARVGMLRFFFADIAEKVMQQVNIPVLLIHPRE
ncbi:MAG: universal stress protein [Chloroflexi bacterium]|jgi:nucleotide-binding universal stress UspA family protein|nr:universal stress protein [Chloroflexota bacterium]